MSSAATARPPAAPAPCPELILADDVTGACDAALPFMATGRTVVVGVRGVPDRGADITAISTESRDLPGAEVVAAVAGVLRRIDARRLRGGRMFKKVDSRLRGAVGAELAIARAHGGGAAVLLAPALPTLGRLVEGGRLHLPGASPIDVPRRLRAGADVAVTTVGATTDATVLAAQLGAAARRADVVVCDARTDAELDTIARAAAVVGPALLLAGSSGLAAALARTAGPGSERHAYPPVPPADRVLFVLGSLHPALRAQLGRLVAARPIARLRLAEVATTGGGSLPAGSLVLESIEAGPRDPDDGSTARSLAGAAAALMRRERFDAVVCSGGAVAAAVCAELRIDALELLRELTPGFPVAGIRPPGGGPALLALRSGGFGGEDDLVDAHDRLRGGAA